MFNHLKLHKTDDFSNESLLLDQKNAWS